MDRAPAIVHGFSDWQGDWGSAQPGGEKIAVDPKAPDAYEYVSFVFQPGTTLALTWSMPLPNYDVAGDVYGAILNVQDILDGEHDDDIRDFARAIDRIEPPVMLTLFGEFDNNAFYSFGPDGRPGGVCYLAHARGLVATLPEEGDGFLQNPQAHLLFAGPAARGLAIRHDPDYTVSKCVCENAVGYFSPNPSARSTAMCASQTNAVWVSHWAGSTTPLSARAAGRA